MHNLGYDISRFTVNGPQVSLSYMFDGVACSVTVPYPENSVQRSISSVLAVENCLRTIVNGGSVGELANRYVAVMLACRIGGVTVDEALACCHHPIEREVEEYGFISMRPAYQELALLQRYDVEHTYYQVGKAEEFTFHALNKLLELSRGYVTLGANE